MKLLRSILTLILMLVWYGSPQLISPALALDEKTANQLEYLREHQLYSLAESFCQERLAQKKQEEPLRIQFTLELAETFEKHAQHVSDDTAREYWNSADHLLTKLQTDSDSPSVKLLALFHQAELHYSQAIHTLRRWQLTQKPEDLKQTRDLLNKAISSLSHLLKTGSYWTNTRKELRQKNEPNFILNTAKTLSLYRRLPLLLADTYLQRAQFLPEQTDVPKDLSAAQALLAKQKSSQLTESLQFKRNLLKAELASLKQEFSQAEQYLSRAIRLTLSPPQQKQLLIAQVRLLLRNQKYADASSLLRESFRTGQPLEGELQYLYVLTISKSVQVAHEKNEPELAKQLQDLIPSALQTEGSPKQDYWFLRGQQELKRLQQDQAYGQELALLINKAQQLYQANEQDQAIDVYRQIIETASQSDQLKVVEETTFTLGSIYIKQKNFIRAAELFSRFPDLSPQSHRVNEAKIMQAYCLGQVLKEKSSHEKRTQTLRDLKLLLQSLRSTSTDISVWSQSTQMLASLAELEQKPDEAILLYLELLKRTPDNEPLLGRLYILYSTVLSQSDFPSESKQNLVESGITQLSPLLSPPTPDTLSYQTDLRTTLSLLYLNLNTKQFHKAADLLPPLFELELESSQQQQVRSRISPVYLQILTSANPTEQAELSPFFKAQARKLLNGSPAQLLELYLSLSKQQPEPSNPLLTTLQKKLDAALDQLPAHKRPEYSLARLKYSLNDLPSEELVKQTNLILDSYQLNQKQLQETALLLTHSPDRNLKEIASKIWKEYEQKLIPGTESWFEARFHQAQILFQTGKKAAAQKLIRRTTLLHQYPEGSSWKSQFDELQQLK